MEIPRQSTYNPVNLSKSESQIVGRIQYLSIPCVPKGKKVKRRTFFTWQVRSILKSVKRGMTASPTHNKLLLVTKKSNGCCKDCNQCRHTFCDNIKKYASNLFYYGNLVCTNILAGIIFLLYIWKFRRWHVLNVSSSTVLLINFCIETTFYDNI